MTEPVLGTFEVVRILGQGGMGSVYEVRLPDDPRRLALKRIHVSNERTVERFRREGELVARLDHPNIVAVRGAGLLPDQSHYLLFDLVEGRSLHEERRERGLYSEEEVLEVGKQIARGLAHAHARGVVHRDIKPANLLRTASGRLLLADFGLAVAEDMERMTRTGQLVGTPMYFAPEQIEGLERICPATDIHAVGVVLYELLTGTPPFIGSGQSSLFEAILKRSPSNVRTERPEISRDLSDLISRCLKKDPNERITDGAALLEQLEQVGSKSGRRRGLMMAGMLALSATVAAIAIAIAGPGSGPPAEPVRAESSAPSPTASASPAGSPEPADATPVGAPFLPRWQPPVGTREDYLFSWFNKNSAALYALDWRATYAVEVSEPRRVVMKVTIRGLKGHMSSQMVRSRIDTSKPAKGEHGMEPLRRLLGRSFQLEIDPRRNTVLVRGARAALAPVLAVTGSGLVGTAALPDFWTDQGLTMMYGALLVHLPPTPVRRGDRWRKKVTCIAPETVVGGGVKATVSLVGELELVEPSRGRYRVQSVGKPVWVETSPQLTPAMRSRFQVRATAEWLKDRPVRVAQESELGPEGALADVSRSSFTRIP